jgi:hypothetical protein
MAFLLNAFFSCASFVSRMSTALFDSGTLQSLCYLRHNPIISSLTLSVEPFCLLSVPDATSAILKRFSSEPAQWIPSTASIQLLLKATIYQDQFLDFLVQCYSSPTTLPQSSNLTEPTFNQLTKGLFSALDSNLNFFSVQHLVSLRNRLPTSWYKQCGSLTTIKFLQLFDETVFTLVFTDGMFQQSFHRHPPLFSRLVFEIFARDYQDPEFHRAVLTEFIDHFIAFNALSLFGFRLFALESIPSASLDRLCQTIMLHTPQCCTVSGFLFVLINRSWDIDCNAIKGMYSLSQRYLQFSGLSSLPLTLQDQIPHDISYDTYTSASSPCMPIILVSQARRIRTRLEQLDRTDECPKEQIHFVISLIDSFLSRKVVNAGGI